MKARFGRYIFLKRLAAGGMAEVFLARRLSFGGFARYVVIKRMLPSLSGQRAYERLFLREARIGALLNHPNIVALYDLGKLDETYFTAMEYVDGVSGAEVMDRAEKTGRTVPLGCALRIIAGVAAGLHHAHHSPDLDGNPLGIVHHDVSPHNIQLSFDGDVKLLDFGVATRLGRPTPKGRRGKYAYMSPEAIDRAENIDGRSDVYSLGVVLYELTTGTRLFKAADNEATLELASIGHVTSPRDLDPKYPVALEPIVMRALAATPEERFQTAGELLRALTDFGQSHGQDDHAETLRDFLASLFGAEIEERQEELRRLARATDPRRKARTKPEDDERGVAQPAGSPDPDVAGNESMGTMETAAPHMEVVGDRVIRIDAPQEQQDDLPAPVGELKTGEYDPPDTRGNGWPQDGLGSGPYDPPDDANETLEREDGHDLEEPAPIASSPAVDPPHPKPLPSWAQATTLLAAGVLVAFALVGGVLWGRQQSPPAPAPAPEGNEHPAVEDTGSLVINSIPEGARVFNDDKLLGITPLEDPNVALGTRYDLRVSMTGFQPWSGTLTLDRKHQHRSVDIVLVRAEKAAIDATPPWPPDAGAQ